MLWKLLSQPFVLMSIQDILTQASLLGFPLDSIVEDIVLFHDLTTHGYSPMISIPLISPLQNHNLGFDFL